MNSITEPTDDATDTGTVEPLPPAARGLTKEQLEAASRVLDHARGTFPHPAAEASRA